MEEALLEFFGTLSNYELADLQNSIWQGLTANFSIYITVLFAYVLLAYFEGKRLSTFQVYAVSGIYTVFQAFMIGFIEDGLTKVLITESLITGRTGVLIGPAFLIVLIVGVIVSLVFMQQARITKQE